VSSAFASLGRVFLCVDRGFRVLHASSPLDHLIGSGASAAASGLPVADLLGTELFGPSGTLRQLLLAGERREGWRSTLTVSGTTPRLVSLTAAPFVSDPGSSCDPRVAYIVVLRPAEEEQSGAGGGSPFPGLIGRSSAMERVFRLIENLEDSDATVLLTGASGTGKEVLARAIHAHSPRRSGPFVGVNCGALPGELLESELFGHVRGAFTGAVRERAGRFEVAAGVFLDEVADLPLHLQVKLLRVLQERTFERVGESQSRPTDARIIAATNVDLRRAVKERRFREDLFYRLRVVPIEIPPLRERREDIEPLATHLLTRVAARHGRALRFSPDALRGILDYDWPGNVREMENALEYAVAVCKGQTILPEDLPAELQGAEPRTHIDAKPPQVPAPALRPLVEDIEELKRALKAHRWRRVPTARALGVSRATLWRRMREAGLQGT
jgi:DNA-binding NtrC family response regulator